MFNLIRFGRIVFEVLMQSLQYAWLWVYSLFSINKDRRLEFRNQGLARCVTSCLKRLGPTFIKVGQILSSRPDLVPDYLIRELQTLQDQVPAFSYPKARHIVEEDLGEPLSQLFKKFVPRPIAAASIAQVHEAWLPSGEKVAVKIMRPNVEVVMHRDLDLIAGFIRLLEYIPGIKEMGFAAMVGEFSSAISSQLDFKLERDNNRRLNSNFRDVSYVRTADVFEHLSSPRIITLEFIEGKKLQDIINDPPIPLSLMSERIFQIFLKMSFKDFFLHADMHPGNLLVDAEGNYIMLDTGLMYEIPKHYVEKYFRVMLAMVSLDPDLMAEAYLEGIEIEEEQLAEAMVSIRVIADKYLSEGADFISVNRNEALNEIFTNMRKYHIVWESEWAGYILADATFEGIAKMLDDQIDFLELLKTELPNCIADLDFINAEDALVRAIS